MYAVGVGRAADIAELQEIASEPEYVYTSPSFKDLQSITSGIRRVLCIGNDDLHLSFRVCERDS